MKCPKCGYIGFDDGDRCRNCGYEFSLLELEEQRPSPAAGGSGERSGAPVGESDARRTPAGEPAPRTWLEQLESARPESADAASPAFGSEPAARAGGSASPPVEREAQVELAPEPPPGTSPSRAVDLDRLIGIPDLPLFREARERANRGDGTPEGKPRPPLAVRRPVPPSPRLRPRPVAVARDDQREAAGDTETPRGRSDAWQPSWHRDMPMEPEAAQAAELGPRLLALALDAALILGIDAVVLYFTLRLCQLDLSGIGLLPLPPLLAFFLLLNGGYVTLFTTAGGQTVGKMALGLRVVGPGDARVEIGRSVLRTLACLPSVGPLGLGYLPAFFDEDRRALHDRLTETRVVTAGPKS